MGAGVESELELIQSQMAQKPMLRGEVESPRHGMLDDAHVSA